MAMTKICKIKAITNVVLETQGHAMKLDFHIMHISRAHVVLGYKWLHGLDSSLKYHYHYNALAFDDCGVYILFMGELDVPASPLICNVEISSLINTNEIESCFVLFIIAISFH